MIKLTDNPEINPNTVENIKIFEHYNNYSDIALFWEQENSNLKISMLDGDMVISGQTNDLEELKGFVDLISPNTVFSNSTLINSLGLKGNIETVNVMSAVSDVKGNYTTDLFSSDDVYKLFSDAFELPDFENFAVDFCLRLNKGNLRYFGIKDTAVAVGIGNDGVLINGIVSNKKGVGTLCLKGLMSYYYGKIIFACCTDSVKPFYLKNGFSDAYKVSYWRK